MFDFAFSELALIGVVALVVIGPERLPRVARTAGVVVGRLQRYAATVKSDIAREVELSELRRVQGEITSAAHSFESSMRESLASAETHFLEGQQALMQGPPAHPADAALGRFAAPPARTAVSGPAGETASADTSPATHPDTGPSASLGVDLPADGGASLPDSALLAQAGPVSATPPAMAVALSPASSATRGPVQGTAPRFTAATRGPVRTDLTDIGAAPTADPAPRSAAAIPSHLL